MGENPGQKVGHPESTEINFPLENEGCSVVSLAIGGPSRGVRVFRVIKRIIGLAGGQRVSLTHHPDRLTGQSEAL
jgi:hypothetical protein